MSPKSKSSPFCKKLSELDNCNNPTNFIGKCTRVLLLLGTLLHIREEEGGGSKKIYIKNGAACSGAKGRRNQWRHGDWSPPNFGFYVHPFLDRGSISCQCSFGPTKIFDIPVPLQLRKFAFVHATQRRRIVRSNICSLLMHKSKGTKHLF